MAPDLVLVVDAGTSGLRSVVVDAGGAGRLRRIAGGHDRDALSLSAVPWPAYPGDADATFGRRIDPADLTGRLVQLLDVPSALRPHIAALAFTGQREGLAIADERGLALLLSRNTDASAAAEGAAIDAAHGHEVYRTTGHLPSLLLAPAKLAWFKQHSPDAAAGVHTVLPLVDWIASCVVGDISRMSRSLAAEIGVLDLVTGEIASPLLEKLGFDASLPDPTPDGTVIGAVAEGPLAGLPVVLAGADTQCSLAGMRAVAPGDCGLPAGWSAPVQLVTARPVLDPEQRTWTGLHVVPERWVLESNAGDTGRAWDWTCSMLGTVVGDAGRIAAEAPPGSRDVVAVIGARAMRASHMTASVGGVTYPLPFAAFSPERSQLLRAALEAIAFAIRANLEQLEAISGVRVEQIRLGGGMSQAREFVRILADVADRPVMLAPLHETSALGAAALAAAAVGVHPSVEAAIAAVSGTPCTIEPDPRVAAEYDDYYARWSMMCDNFERVSRET